MQKLICTLLFIYIVCLSAFVHAQIIYGTNNYIEFHIGNLPIIISVPHGGNLTPVNIPDRTCNNPTTITDSYTIELAQQIDSGFQSLTGCKPHVIYCNLKRTKIDCNRNLADGACGNPDAIIAWNEFQNFIDTAQQIAQNQYGGNAFYFDLHGHGHTIQQLELGYLLSATELGYTDSVLNTQQFIDSSSIKNLVVNNVNGFTHSEMLRGSFALGTVLANAGYPSVPSMQTLSPNTNPYFNGGYNTATHTCYSTGNTVNGVQIETNYTNVRNNSANRKTFGDSLASVLIQYLKIHQNINVSNCATVGINELTESENIFLSPTIISRNTNIKIHGIDLGENRYSIKNTIGQEVASGIIDSQNELNISKKLLPGFYLIVIVDKTNHTFKIIVQ